jgi:hypothetical protein
MPRILDQHFIGRVRWIEPDLGIGGLEPLWMETKEGFLLQPVNSLLFPETGEVFWSSPPEDAEKGELWRFVLKENQKGPTIKQAYAAAFPAPAKVVTVVDLRCWGAEAVRRDLTHSDKGLRIPFDLHGLVYLWLEEEVWVGPLSPRWESGRWFLNPGDYKDPLRCVFPSNISTLLPADLLIPKDQASCFLLKPLTNLRNVGQLDWSSDEVVLKRVLRAGASLTQAQIDQLVSGLDAALLADSSSLLEKSRRERVAALVDVIKRNRKAADAYGDVLLKLPTVEKKLADEKAQILLNYRKQIEDELKQLRDEITNLQAEKEEITQCIDEYSTEKVRLAKEVEDSANAQTQAIVERVEEAKTRLRERWEVFRNDVVPDLSQLEILRVLMGDQLSSSVSPIRTSAIALSESRASWPWTQEGVKTHSASKMFNSALKESVRAMTFRSSGTAGRIARSLSAVFLADALPVLAGDGARGALDAFGTIAVGGRVLRLSVSPNTLEPANLCGSSTGGVWRREQNGLLDLLDTARQSMADKDERLFMIVLEGINRAPVETYLQPFLAAFHSRFLKKPITVSPLGDIGIQCWPSNVLLAATMCDGVARVTPGVSFWSDAVLIHLDSFLDDHDDDTLPSVDNPPPSQVNATQWGEWRQANQSTTQKCDEILLEGLGQYLGLRRDLAPQSRRVWAQLNHLSVANPEKIIAQWMSLLFPAPIISAGKKESGLEWVQTGPYDFAEWPLCLDCAQKCLS